MLSCKRNHGLLLLWELADETGSVGRGLVKLRHTPVFEYVGVCLAQPFMAAQMLFPLSTLFSTHSSEEKVFGHERDLKAVLQASVEITIW